ncbi:MAG TPA: hypothetical protein VII61_20715, partial [Ktedonobacteraceae bacterium]
FAIIFIITTKKPTISFAQFFPNSSLYITLLLIYIFSFFSNLSQQRYWKRIEQRRFAAAENKHAFPTVKQPAENSEYLHLPSTLQARPGKKSIPFIIGISLIFTLLLIGLPAWFNNNFLFFSPDRLHNFLILFAIVASVMIILLLALFLSPLGTQKIIVTEQNLSIYAGGQKNTVQWNDIRLFAIYNAFGAQKSGSVLTYELSSTSDIVRWNWVQCRDRFNMRIVPTIPLDEYNRQMQALNALIVARTGLSLSDLRTNSTKD